MATVTWQGDDVTNPTLWNVAANWDTGNVPVDGDDVVINNAADCNVNAATASLASLDMTGYTGTLSGASTITIRGLASSTKVCKFAGTITWTGTLNLNAVAVDAVIQLTMGTLSTSGTCGGITIGGNASTGYSSAGAFFMDGVVLAATKILAVNVGALHFDGADDAAELTHTIGLFATGNSTKNLIFGASTLNVIGAATTEFNASGSNTTVTAGTSIINMTGADQLFQGGTSKTWYTVNFTGSGTATLNAYSCTFTNLSRIGTAVKTDAFALATNFTVNGTLNLQGNSAINRLLVRSTILGDINTITLGASATCRTAGTQNVDIRDTTMTGGAANERDLSAITGLSGDGGGNTGITTTDPTTQTWDGSTANADEVAHWTSRVPLRQDTIVFGGGTGTCTWNLTYIGSFSFTSAVNLTAANAMASYGDIDFTNAGTFTLAGFDWSISNRDRVNPIHITSAGKSFNSSSNKVILLPVDGVTIQLMDAMSVANLDYYSSSVTGSTLDLNGNTLTVAGVFTLNGSPTRTINIGSGTLSFSSTSTVLETTGVSNVTVSATTGGITCTSTSSSLKTLELAGLSWGKLTIPSGTGGVAITGDNTFTTIQAPNGGKLRLASTSTQTLTGDMSEGFGNGENTFTLYTSSAGTAATLDYDGTGKIQCDYLNITDTNVTPASTWYYGNNSTYNSGTGWVAGLVPNGMVGRLGGILSGVLQGNLQ